MLRTGSAWRALPLEFGSWPSIYSRFRRWQIKGYWKAIFQALSKESDLESMMIDGIYIHAYQHAAGAKGSIKNRLWAAVAEALQANYT